MQPTTRRLGRPKGSKIAPPATTIQALDRALDVLEALAARGGMTLSELSAHLAQSPATMHRVLAALAARRYVECNPDQQQWFVGAEAFRLGSAFLRRTNVIETSRPVMRDLMLRSGETSNLGVESDGSILFVSQVETQESIRAFFPPGTRAPLHASGIGKALLSSFDEKRLATFITTAPFVRFTDQTIVSADQLRSAIRQIKERGYALDDEERTIGMRCVAAPILDGYGQAVAGISVSGPTLRMPDFKVREIGHWIVEAAAEASRKLGFAG